jgi:hypothetical protein
MRIHTVLALAVGLLAALPAPASGTLDAEASAAVVAAWRESLSTVDYPNVTVLVEYREKWAVHSHYVLLSIAGQVITAHALLLNPAPDGEASESPSPTWRTSSVTAASCPRLAPLAKALLELRLPLVPSNVLTLDPATYAVTVATASAQTAFRVNEPEGSFWGDPGTGKNPLPGWVQRLIGAITACNAAAA